MKTVKQFGLKNLMLLAFSSALIACGGSATDPSELTTPRSELPAELAGSWYTGTLSTIQYYDKRNGSWLDPSGEGFYFIFSADGGYETGAVIVSTVAGCTMKLLGSEIGTVELEGDTLTAHRAWIRTNVTNDCGSSGENEDGSKVSDMIFALDTDEFGKERLTLENEYGVATYRRWE